MIKKTEVSFLGPLNLVDTQSEGMQPNISGSIQSFEFS